MNQKKAIVMGVTLAAFSIMTTANLRASAIFFTNTVSITATAVSQGGTNDNGRTTSVSSVNSSITTKQLLSWLAQDEHAEGNFTTSNNFPSGAVLVLIATSSDNSVDFKVLSKNGTPLVDVSDILSLNRSSGTINTAKISDTTGLLSPSGTQTRLLSLTFDDSSLIAPNGLVNLQFDLSGVEVKTVSDTTPRSGTHTESVSAKITSANGEGTLNGNPFIISGSFSFTGKAVISTP
jgi:hypothetical protein